MNYLVWRQHRTQAAFAFGALVVLAVVFLLTGLHAADIYRSASASCSNSGGCGDLSGLFHNYGPLFRLVGLTAVIPALFGLFWGAPLVAHEFEEGTQQLAWTQTVTRRHWLAVKSAWLLLAGAVWGAAIGWLISWWSGPENSVFEYRFDLGHFDTQGIVPIGYSVFAVALGITVGLVIRRVLPALAVTLAAFAGIRFLVDYVLRPNYLAPLKQTTPLGSSQFLGKGSVWTLGSSYLDPFGRHLDALRFTPATMPPACRAIAFNPTSRDSLGSCLGKLGYRQVTAFQPADRFWTFQGIETGIFIVLTAAVLAVAFYLINRRDA